MFNLTYEEELQFHNRIANGMIFVSIPIFLVLYYVVPGSLLWGKTTNSKKNSRRILIPMSGITVNGCYGWIFFESPNLIWAAICYSRALNDPQSPIQQHILNKFLLSLFVLHYINRGIIYPLYLNSKIQRPPRAPIPIEVVISATLYTTLNGYLQCQNLCQFSSTSMISLFNNDDDDDTINSKKLTVFIVGLLLFVFGAYMNIQSDLILCNLKKRRKSNTSKSSVSSKQQQQQQQQRYYKIPYGGIGFQFVSCPHYLGEIIEWAGFSIMHMAGGSRSSKAPWAFCIFTACNLIPRAVAQHQWYLQQFPTVYSKLNRKAIIPYLW